MRRYLATLWFVLVLVGTPLACMAQDTSSGTPDLDQPVDSKTFEFYPADTGWGSFFAPEIKAGSSESLVALLGNTGTVTQDLRLYSVSASTAPGGGFLAGDYGAPVDQVTSWLDFPEEVITLDPGLGVEREFTVNVPEGTRPGHYITAVVGEQAEASEVEGTDLLTQKLRYVVPVFITVPGDAEARMDIGDITITSGPDFFAVDVQVLNPGDLRLRPSGVVEVLDESGALLVSFDVVMDSVYARDETVLTLGATGVLPKGSYQVRVQLRDDETGITAERLQEQVIVDPAATPEPTLIHIGAASLTPAPSADDVQFANVQATITNDGEPVANAQLALIARVNGEEVERFPISQSLSLPTGETPIETRYIPATGWTSGEWTFELLLETVEPGGAAVVVGRLPIEGSIVIP